MRLSRTQTRGAIVILAAIVLFTLVRLYLSLR